MILVMDIFGRNFAFFSDILISGYILSVDASKHNILQYTK